MLRKLVLVSRPRFWLYLAGPFLLGAVISGVAFWQEPVFWWVLVFFLVPANILLYAVNDYFDADTDAYSSKKRGKEFIFSGERWVLSSWVVCAVIGVGVAWALRSWLVAGFLLLAVFYSAPPIRFKARLLLDSLSNVLYVLPGFLGYSLFSGLAPAWWAVVGAWAWASAMHLFSAVPDIPADKKAGLRTTAVVVGKDTALVICSVWWVLSLVAALGSLSWLAGVLVLYPVFSAVLVGRSLQVVARAYWYFPFINAGVGLFLVVSLLLL